VLRAGLVRPGDVVEVMEIPLDASGEDLPR